MKILYITNLFGIIGSSAAVRNSALINGLAGNGHIVDVLTIKYPNNRISSTLRSCSYNAIFETELGVMDVVQGIANVRKNINNSLLRRIKKDIRELFFFPDIYVSWAEKINPNEFGHYDLLISSSDYKSSHYVAKKIKQVFPSLRWIQIWGDPWSIDSMLSRLTKLRAKRQEKRLLSMADKVVYVSELTSKAIIDMYPYLADKIHYDKLYILDVWGYKGSYYLFENGTDVPRKDTLSLLNFIMSKKRYKQIVTLGTSKGGTAAIYYGLTIKASTIIAGACQYNLGNYLILPEHIEIFKGMMGEEAGTVEKDKLNSILPMLLERCSKETFFTTIHLVYSKYEHTYEDDIVDLLKKLKECHYSVIEKEYDFLNHNDVGIYFKKYINDFFATIS